jgi:hypothetical protein
LPEWTILDPYGTPYGGQRGNHDKRVVVGGAGYESAERVAPSTYGDVLEDVSHLGRNNVSGRA